jgi:ABC-type Na+ efflux pump permease subunit
MIFGIGWKKILAAILLGVVLSICLSSALAPPTGVHIEPAARTIVVVATPAPVYVQPTVVQQVTIVPQAPITDDALTYAVISEQVLETYNLIALLPIIFAAILIFMTISMVFKTYNDDDDDRKVYR